MIIAIEDLTFDICYRASLENFQLTYTMFIFGYDFLSADSGIFEMVLRTLLKFPEYS